MNKPPLPERSLENGLLTFLSDLGKNANPPVDKPSDDGPVEVSNISADEKIAATVVPATKSSVVPTESKVPLRKVEGLRPKMRKPEAIKALMIPKHIERFFRSTLNRSG